MVIVGGAFTARIMHVCKTLDEETCDERGRLMSGWEEEENDLVLLLPSVSIELLDLWLLLPFGLKSC